MVSIQAFPENAVVRRRFQLEPGVEQAAAVDVTQQTAFGQVLRELAFVHAQHEHDAGIDGANTVDAADEHFVERCGDPADVKGGKGAEEQFGKGGVVHFFFPAGCGELVENLHKYVPGLGRFLRKIRLALFEQGLRFALQFLRDTTFQ